MARTYQVISADGHVETPPESWVKYVPTKWKERAPRLITLPDGEAWVVEGRPLLWVGKSIAAGKPVRLKGGSYFNADGSPAAGAGGGAAQRLREQDQDGIDAEVLFPPTHATTFIEGITDRDVYFSMVQAYNSYLGEEYCAVAPDRLIGNVLIPISGVDHAVAELKRAKEMGLPSISLHKFPNGSGQAKPEDDEFWETALSIGMALSPHFGFGDKFSGVSGTGEVGYAAACGELAKTAGDHHAVHTMMQLMVSGVLDRFPELRFYFAESEVSWLPTAMARMDKNYATFKDWFHVELKRLPSEYIKKHFYFGLVTDPFVIQMQHFLPMDHLMWGSDFPHAAGTFPHSEEALKNGEAGVPPEWARKILLETPAEYYGLDLEKPLTPTPN